MTSSGFNRRYLPFLVEALRTAETEIETLESYINEDNFDEFFADYLTTQKAVSDLRREIPRVGKALGMKKKQIRELLNP